MSVLKPLSCVSEMHVCLAVNYDVILASQGVPDWGGDPPRQGSVPEHEGGDICGEVPAGEQDSLPSRLPSETSAEATGRKCGFVRLA